MNRQIVATIILIFFSPILYAEPGAELNLNELNSKSNNAPVSWDKLTAKQQKILESVKSNWSEMKAARQHRLLKGASRWATLDKRERRIAAAKFKKFRTMNSERRTHLRTMFNNYKKLPKPDRIALRAAKSRFNNFSESKKEMLRKQWQSMTVQQRRAIIRRRLIRQRILQLQKQNQKDRVIDSSTKK